MSERGRDLGRILRGTNRRLGYVGWTVAHPITVRARPQRRFLVLAEPRSGSSLLCDLLDSHPDISCQGELLRQRHPRLSPEAFADGRAAQSRLRGAKVFGFKLIATTGERLQIVLPATLVPRLVADGYILIGLQRRDLLAQVLSWAHARAQAQWHWQEVDDRARQPVVVSREDLYLGLERFEATRRVAETLIGDHGRLALVYEDDLRDGDAQQATADRVFRLLGLAPAPASTSVVKAGPTRLADRVANLDEVIQALEESRWANLVPALGLDG